MSSDRERTELAAEVIATALAMERRGINNGMSGNVSARLDDGLMVTPSSVAYEALTPADIVFMDFEGTWTAANDRQPSSEWRFHLDIMAAREDAEAVVHAHPINTTALAVHRRGIDSFHYMVGVAGGVDIRCADYATFGTEQLSTNVLEALADRTACLLANHGLVAIGTSLDSALNVAVEVEVLAAQYLAALSIGEPTKLTAAEMADVLAKMASGPGYGSSATNT